MSAVEKSLQVVGVQAQRPAQNPHIEILIGEHFIHNQVESGQVGPHGNAHLVQPPLNPDGKGGAQRVVAGAGRQDGHIGHRLAVGHPQALARLLDEPAVLADPRLRFPREPGILEQLHRLGYPLAPAQPLADQRHVGVVPGLVALGHRGVHGQGHSLQHRAGDKFLVNQRGHRLPERLVAHRFLAEVEAEIPHAVRGVFDNGQPVLALQLFLQPARQAQGIEHEVDVALLDGKHRGVLAAVDGVDDALGVRAYGVLQGLVAAGVSVGGELVGARLGFGVGAAGVLRHRAAGEVVIGVAFLLGERAALPLAEPEPAGGGFVFGNVGVEDFLLLQDVAGLFRFVHHGFPVGFGDNGHERLAELPARQPRLLLEVDFETVRIQRLRVVEVIGVNDGCPVAGQFQLGDRVRGEGEILGGDVVAVAPLYPLLEGNLGSPVGLAANGFLRQWCREIGGERRDPVKPLRRV